MGVGVGWGVGTRERGRGSLRYTCGSAGDSGFGLPRLELPGLYIYKSYFLFSFPSQYLEPFSA